MKKLLFILLLTIPFIGFGQGWDVKLGTNFLTPFSNQNDLPSCEYCLPHKKTTGIGLNSSISYLFIFEKVNPKITFSPSVSYSLINYHTEDEFEYFKVKKDLKDHYINFSSSIGYKINNTFSTSIGLCFDTQIKRKEIGQIEVTSLPDNGDLVFNDGQIIETENNEPTIKGFSCLVSVEYNINPSFYIFTQLKIPVSIWGYEESPETNSTIGINDYVKKLNLQERKYMSLGIGYNIF